MFERIYKLETEESKTCTRPLKKLRMCLNVEWVTYSKSQIVRDWNTVCININGNELQFSLPIIVVGWDDLVAVLRGYVLKAV